MEAVWEQYLHSDQKESGVPILPPDMDFLHDEILKGPFVLQIVEFRNIGEAMEKRGDETASRCLRFTLTDGTALVQAFEYRKLSVKMAELTVGSKVSLRDVLVKRGTLFLTPLCFTFLGGSILHEESNQNEQEEGDSVIHLP